MPRSDRLNREELLDRQAFQLGLLEALRSVADPLQAMGEVARAIGEKLDLRRVGYAEVEADGATVHVTHDWIAPPAISLTGAALHLDDFGPEAVGELRAGRTMIVADAATDPRTRAMTEPYERLGVQSTVVCPLVRDGALSALLFAHDGRPREWTQAELALIEDAALRTQESVERARAEQALRESERRYRSLFNSIDAGFCVIEMRFDAAGRPADYRFLEVNDAFEANTGIVNAGGRWMREIAPDHEQHWFDTYGRVALTGKSERFELPAQELGDRWYMVHAYRVDAPELHHVAILFSDLTERRRTERALEENREELELATRAARLGRFDYRVQSGTLKWDDRCRELFGLSPGAPVSYDTAFLAGLHPDDRERADAAVAAALDPAGNHGFDVEYRTIGIEDGIERHIAAHGVSFFEGDTPLRLIGTVQDVTKDRQAQARIRETEERLRLAGRATNDAIWDWDLRRDQVLWNESIEQAYGHALDQVGSSGAWWIGHIHPEDRARIDASIHAVIDADGNEWTDEYRFQRADGSYADVLDRGYVIRDGAGAPLRMIGAMLDLTTRKALERQLLRENEDLEKTVATTTAERDRAEEALRQAQKMEAVGQLTGGLAHDFNNLLGAISGALEMIHFRIERGQTGELDRYTDMAGDAVRRAAALTHRLLAFSRRQTLDPRATDPTDLVDGMAELIRRTLGPSISLALDLARPSWTIMIDPHQLENALLNLCINARDAMPGGGDIRIQTTTRTIDAPQAAEEGLEPGDYLAISVSDTGTGMSADVASRAFEPFFTTKPMGGGTGLGLSMIYGFARQSGGAVRIESGVGEGTTVTISLPRHKGPARPVAAPAEGELLSAAQTSTTILVVDDEESIRRIVGELVEELGCRALQAGDAASALDILKGDAPIDLIVTDVGLPGDTNGRDLAEAAMAVRPGLKILFITGFAEASVLGSAPLSANMAVLTKPFALTALSAKVRELLG